ncbi:hypothetical protein RRF57_005290 [Xylaria bambusicola]|uniref:Uncharacterized protein n=1 Tax=Xylaria bambusicola TaxID=326684 RepID=A0AAN7UCA5_9PEZI
MASSTDQALEAINQSYKDILIQVGKHFRVMAKDGPGALNGTHNGIQARASEALAQYHLALNEIESEIIRARSVLLRDLENLNAARAPAPIAAPVPAPVPIPTPQPAAPPAPMMELPSAAAHSRNLNAAVAPAAATTYPSSKETKTVAPFPDMGTGMSSDVVDLTAGEKKPSPRVQAGSIKAVARSAPSTNVKPSPKPVHKPIPPAKVTPVPPPQIPRLQSAQSSNSSTHSKSQPPKIATPVQPAQPPQQAPAAKTVQDNAMDNTLSLPATKATDEAGIIMGGGEQNFTHMEFSLAPTPNEPQGAPPAPMPEFDLAGFAPQGGNNNNSTTNNTTGSHTMQSSNANSNMDDLFNLGDTSGGGDNMFDLGGGEANDSTFDDLMFFGNNDTDMAQFDDAYFGI